MAWLDIPKRSEVFFSMEVEGAPSDGGSTQPGRYMAAIDYPSMEVLDLEQGRMICTVADLIDDRKA